MKNCTEKRDLMGSCGKPRKPPPIKISPPTPAMSLEYLEQKIRSARETSDEESSDRSEDDILESSPIRINVKQNMDNTLAPVPRTRYKRSMSRGGRCTLHKKWRLCNLKYYARDLFTTLIDSRWRVILWIFVASFVSSWFFFGLFWWVIAYSHGDLLTSPHPDTQQEPCVTMVEDMVSAFMFSLETQYTTGYGTRSPTTECPEAIFLICVQSIFGMLQESVMVGIVFAKLARPKARSQAIIFSERAVVSMRDGQLHLMIRVADVRKSNLIACKVFAWILTHRTTQEGEQLPNYQRRIRISVDEGGSNLFLLWPVTVIHRIDRRSPLYELSAMELMSSQFEVVVSLVCTSESTGQSTEARRSYTPSEIFWGHRFQTMVDRCEGRRGGGLVDYALFDKTVTVETPLCSQRQLDQWSTPNSPTAEPNDMHRQLPWMCNNRHDKHATDTT